MSNYRVIPGIEFVGLSADTTSDLGVWKMCFELAKRNGWQCPSDCINGKEYSEFSYTVRHLTPDNGGKLDPDLYIQLRCFSILYDMTSGFAKALFGEAKPVNCGGGITMVEHLPWNDHLSRMIGQNPTEYLRKWLMEINK